MGHLSRAREPLSKEGAFHLLAHDKYLLLIAGLVVLLNWVNSSGEYLLDRALLVAAGEASARGANAQEFVGAFKANYFAWYNAIGMVLQLFAVSRILALVGVRGALLVMPAFAFVAYGAAIRFPVLAVMRLVKIGENSLQYSLQDTTRHALFLAARRRDPSDPDQAHLIAVAVGARGPIDFRPPGVQARLGALHVAPPAPCSNSTKRPLVRSLAGRHHHDCASLGLAGAVPVYAVLVLGEARKSFKRRNGGEARVPRDRLPPEARSPKPEA